MVKKLLALSLLPVCVYAADKEPYSPLVELAREWKNEEDYGGRIWPSSFNEYGKGIITHYVQVWVDAAKQGNVPQGQGLAKLFVDMQNDGVEKLINDADALKKTNEYDDEYVESGNADIEGIIKCKLKPGKNGNYSHPGAAQSNTDRIRIARQSEFYNIMYKRHESPIMPEDKLVGWYYDVGIESALKLLKLNQNNTSLSPAAIRGITLLSAYKLQQDKES